MKIKVINGPNLNMLGIRERAVYGEKTYQELLEMINTFAEEHSIEINVFQSNHEGAIIDEIHSCLLNDYSALVINPGAYTHYSYAIRDALTILTIPVVEVHISDIYAREDFRKINVISDVVTHSIIGQGINGYIRALEYILEI